MTRKYRRHGEKALQIIEAVAMREDYGKSRSIYAIAKHLGYTPNGSFCESIWACVDLGWLDARPVSRGNRFAWQLTTTTSGQRHYDDYLDHLEMKQIAKAEREYPCG